MSNINLENWRFIEIIKGALVAEGVIEGTVGSDDKYLVTFLAGAEGELNRSNILSLAELQKFTLFPTKEKLSVFVATNRRIAEQQKQQQQTGESTPNPAPTEEEVPPKMKDKGTLAGSEEARQESKEASGPDSKNENTH